MLRNLVSQRNLILISAGLLILTAMTVVRTPKRALAGEGVPIKGNFTMSHGRYKSCRLRRRRHLRRVCNQHPPSLLCRGTGYW
jgi:hypothetical protein